MGRAAADGPCACRVYAVSLSGFIAKRKQASRTPNASRIMTSRSRSEPQCLKEQPNLAAAFGVREACFRFGLSHASMLFGIGRTGELFLFQVQCQWTGRRLHSGRSK